MTTLLASDLCGGRHPVLERICVRMPGHSPRPCADIEIVWWTDDLHAVGECQTKIKWQGHEIDALIESNNEQAEAIRNLEIQIANLSRENNTLRRRLGDE